jgi:hypothetical protein
MPDAAPVTNAVVPASSFTRVLPAQADTPQNAKCPRTAYDLSFERLGSGPDCPLLADIVAKVFLGWRTKILRAADALYARQRFIQNRSRTSAVALKSDAAAEKSKDQLSRDFPGRSIFDFWNNIGTFRT